VTNGHPIREPSHPDAIAAAAESADNAQLYLQLPLDRPHTPGARPVWAYSSAAELNELTAPLAQPQRVALLASCVALLARYTQQNQLALSVIGSVLRSPAEKPRASTAHADLGWGETGQPVRSTVSVLLSGDASSEAAPAASQDPTFAELTERVERALAAAASTSAQPPNVALLFAGSFADSADAEALLRSRASAARALTHTPSEDYELCFVVYEQAGRIMLVLAYDAALLDAATVARWQLGFTVLLAHALFDPETRLSVLPVISSSELLAIERVCTGPDTRAPEEHADEPMLMRFERLARAGPRAKQSLFPTI